MRVEISREFSFEAAHSIPNHKGACKNLHGHTYEGSVTIASDELDDMGMVMDYGDLKLIINEEIADKYDHTMLNDFFDKPTAEVMVLDMFNKIKGRLPSPRYTLVEVILKETRKSCARVRA